MSFARMTRSLTPGMRSVMTGRPALEGAT
jgi:hypothetical protein